MATEYRGYPKPKGVCDLKGCNRRSITLLLSTYHDNGTHDRDVKFCSESHLICWTLCYAKMEEQGWTKEAMPSQPEVNELEAIVEEVIEDFKKE
jgi:hypothetical protein